jgi:hypothetical protein
LYCRCHQLDTLSLEHLLKHASVVVVGESRWILQVEAAWVPRVSNVLNTAGKRWRLRRHGSDVHCFFGGNFRIFTGAQRELPKDPPFLVSLALVSARSNERWDAVEHLIEL